MTGVQTCALPISNSQVANDTPKAGVDREDFANASKSELKTVVNVITELSNDLKEKVSRIAEVIISSVKPFQLMMGKIIGIGAVGLIQFLIWGVLIIVIQLAVPVLFPQLFEGMQAQPVQPGMMAAVDATKQQPDMIKGLMEGLNQINFPLIVGCFYFIS